MSQTVDMPNYTIELSDGLIRPMTVKELGKRCYCFRRGARCGRLGETVCHGSGILLQGVPG